MKMKKIIGLTQGVNVPSRRFRWSQYTDDFNAGGFEASELISFFGAYPPQGGLRRWPWFALTAFDGFVRTIRSRSGDLIFLQRNIISTLCTWEPMLKRPFVFDVDDAIFLGPRGKNADRISEFSTATICGNSFLANHFSKYSNVVIIPTAVDTSLFKREGRQESVNRVIGWSGSSSGFKYLYSIELALMRILEKYSDVIIKIVSDRAPSFKIIPGSRVVFERWTPLRENAVLNEFSIGIMPLENDDWTRGKCSYKMLTYMAVGVPVVVSPFGMNAEILRQAACGLGPRNMDEWIDAISSILDSSTFAFEMGKAGINLIESRYSKNVVAPQLLKVLNSLC